MAEPTEKGAVPPGESGFSLMELMIVVAILGLIAVIATMVVSQTIKRQRLAAAAGQLQAFMEKAYVLSIQDHSPVFVVLLPQASNGSRTVELVRDSNTDQALSAGDPVMDRLLLTNDILVSNVTWPSTTWGGNTVNVLLCDMMGRTMDPTVSPPKMASTPLISLTRFDMTGSNPSLSPAQRYDLSMDQLWHVSLAGPIQY